MLNTKKVEVNGTKYVVQEITIGKMMPLMAALQNDDPEVQQKAQLDMVRASVKSDDGKLLGDEVENLGLSTYMALVKAVLAVNGMSDAAEGMPGN